jgi:superfamily II DNA/RNA helicase
MYNQRNRSFNRNNQNRFRNNNFNRGRKVIKFVSKELLISAINQSRLNIKNSSELDEKYTNKYSFADFPISNIIKDNIMSKGYLLPTPIQDQTIMPILEGKDIIGIANTGTGKTAAFLIPLIDKVLKNPLEKVLIVTPTRELASQIFNEMRDYSKKTNVRAVVCIGGSNLNMQKMNLRQGYNFLIGTPGRIRDLIGEKAIFLNNFKNVVLDETDRMVDIGFITDINYFISLLPQERQSLFFSATVSDKVKEIIDQFVKNPITISVKKQETINNIEQNIVLVNDRKNKVEQLHNLLINQEYEKVLIFGRTKWGVQKLTEELVHRGFKAGSIHGDKRQSQRQRTLQDFKMNKIKILLATDVASRGLDINDVSHVINYELPETYEDYVHRIGRTGRANKKGKALTFIE